MRIALKAYNEDVEDLFERMWQTEIGYRDESL